MERAIDDCAATIHRKQKRVSELASRLAGLRATLRGLTSAIKTGDTAASRLGSKVGVLTNEIRAAEKNLELSRSGGESKSRLIRSITSEVISPKIPRARESVMVSPKNVVEATALDANREPDQVRKPDTKLRLRPRLSRPRIDMRGVGSPKARAGPPASIPEVAESKRPLSRGSSARRSVEVSNSPSSGSSGPRRAWGAVSSPKTGLASSDTRVSRTTSWLNIKSPVARRFVARAISSEDIAPRPVSRSSSISMPVVPTLSTSPVIKRSKSNSRVVVAQALQTPRGGGNEDITQLMNSIAVDTLLQRSASVGGEDAGEGKNAGEGAAKSNRRVPMHQQVPAPVALPKEPLLHSLLERFLIVTGDHKDMGSVEPKIAFTLPSLPPANSKEGRVARGEAKCLAQMAFPDGAQCTVLEPRASVSEMHALSFGQQRIDWHGSCHLIAVRRSDGTSQRYGLCVRSSRVTDAVRNGGVVVPVSLCFVSTQPCFAWLRALAQAILEVLHIHRVRWFSRQQATGHTGTGIPSHPLPHELKACRDLLRAARAVQVPGRGHEAIVASGGRALRYQRPATVAGDRMSVLESCAAQVWARTRISAATLVRVIAILLMETSLVVVHPNAMTVSSLVLSLVPLIGPLAWQGAFLPLLPDSMRVILSAPVPRLLGLQSAPSAHEASPDDVLWDAADGTLEPMGGRARGKPLWLRAAQSSAAKRLERELGAHLKTLHAHYKQRRKAGGSVEPAVATSVAEGALRACHVFVCGIVRDARAAASVDAKTTAVAGEGRRRGSFLFGLGRRRVTAVSNKSGLPDEYLRAFSSSQMFEQLTEL